MNMMNRPHLPHQTPRSNGPVDRIITPPQGALRAAPGQQRANPNKAGAPTRAIQAGANANRGDEMISVIRQLTDVLSKENAALKRHKTEEVRVLGEKKESLARLYQQHMNAIHRDPEAVKTWDPAKRNALAQASIRLSELMRDNASLLKANITTINKFLKTVVDAVKEKNEKGSASYSKQGALNGYAAVKRNVAMSYNQTL